MYMYVPTPYAFSLYTYVPMHSSNSHIISPNPVLHTHITRYSPLPGTLLSTTVMKGSSGLKGGGVLA